jgi:predicted nucleic acid-binding protein
MAISSRRTRVFLDSNVIASGFFSRTGPPAQILDLHAAHEVEIVISQQVLWEVRSTAAQKMPGRLPAIVGYFLSSPPQVMPDPEPERVSRVLPIVNFDDAPIFVAALTAGVDFFVTGDRQFLREARAAEPSFAVVTPRELIERLEGSR